MFENCQNLEWAHAVFETCRSYEELQTFRFDNFVKEYFFINKLELLCGIVQSLRRLTQDGYNIDLAQKISLKRAVWGKHLPKVALKLVSANCTYAKLKKVFYWDIVSTKDIANGIRA